LESYAKRFGILKSQGVEIEEVLDIGAYRGEFTDIVKIFWPNCNVQQFEADERQKPYIPNAKFVLLGDKDRKVDFYTLSEKSNTSGSSIFLENTSYYDEHLIIKKKMTTLDKVVKMQGNWSKGLIKIDTQGSELLILQGAKKLLANKPRYIILECSVQEYNIEAPLIDEVIKTMQSYNYRIHDIMEIAYKETGELLQMDILFEVLK